MSAQGWQYLLGTIVGLVTGAGIEHFHEVGWALAWMVVVMTAGAAISTLITKAAAALEGK